MVPDDTSSTETTNVFVPEIVNVELELKVDILFPLLKEPTLILTSKYSLLVGLFVTDFPSSSCI